MKTKQEIHKADKRELAIAAKKEAADRAAHQELNEATKDERALFQPALDRWLAFCRPYWKEYKAKLMAAGKAEAEALAEVRSNWKVCPKCRTPAARYQVLCSNEICNYVFTEEQANE